MSNIDSNLSKPPPSDDVSKLPSDKTPVPSSHLEMLDVIFKDDAKMKSIGTWLKDPVIAGALFGVLNMQITDSLIRKLSGSSENILVYKIGLFVILFMIFREKK